MTVRCSYFVLRCADDLSPAVIATGDYHVLVTSAVGIYNDFVGLLYFLPGNENVTAQ